MVEAESSMSDRAGQPIDELNFFHSKNELELRFLTCAATLTSAHIKLA